MTSNDYVQYVLTVYSDERPSFIRLGQWAFNKLAETHPEIAEEIRGNDELDPFHKTENLRNLFNYLIVKITMNNRIIPTKAIVDHS